VNFFNIFVYFNDNNSCKKILSKIANNIVSYHLSLRKNIKNHKIRLKKLQQPNKLCDSDDGVRCQPMWHMSLNAKYNLREKLKKKERNHICNMILLLGGKCGTVDNFYMY
jgi:hypothetical protein